MSPTIFGIVNITEDSFSDGGTYLSAEAAIDQARKLAADGASVLDLGAAASNPDAKPVAPEDEIARLEPVVEALKRDGLAVSIDSFAPEVQRWALAQQVDYLNDIQGFPYPELYQKLAASSVKLVVMHSVQGRGIATRIHVPAHELMDRILEFFEVRITSLVAAGIARERLILDPGMGLFLGSDQTPLHRPAPLAGAETGVRLACLGLCFAQVLLKKDHRSGQRRSGPRHARCRALCSFAGHGLYPHPRSGGPGRWACGSKGRNITQY